MPTKTLTILGVLAIVGGGLAFAPAGFVILRTEKEKERRQAQQQRNAPVKTALRKKPQLRFRTYWTLGSRVTSRAR